MATCKFIPLVFVLLFSSAVHAGDNWETTDTVLLTSALSATAIDWVQTRYIAKNPNPWREEGNRFFLGSHPSVGRVNTYFAGYMLTTIGLAYVLPQNYRKLYLGGITLYETSLVLNNHRIGIRASF